MGNAPDKNFMMEYRKNGFKILITSSMANIDRADHETREFLNNRGLGDNSFAVSLGIREGMTNAILHAHGKDEAKLIRYSLSVKADALVIEIEDEGNGFDWQAVMSRKPSPNADHGRGIDIIRKYSSELRFNKKGNKLRFEIPSQT